MPFPNEHAARVLDPAGFEPGSFRRIRQDSSGKPYFRIVARAKGKTSTSTQALRYPKDKWTPSAAKEHAQANKATSFEAAKKAASVGAFVIGLAGEQAAPAGGVITADDQTTKRRYTKDLIRVGKFSHPIEDWVLDVTADRLAKWLASFKKMRENGVDVEVLADHAESGTRADSIRGYMVDAFIEGETLVGVLEMSGEKGIDLAETVKNVSVEIQDPFTDGEGNKYGEVIAAVAIVEKPIVSGQQPFRRAASMAATGDIPVFLDDEPEPIEDGDMDKKLLSAIKALSGNENEVTEDNAAKVLEAFGTWKKKQVAELKTVKASLAELKTKATGDMPEVDEDVLEDLAETRTTELNQLVREGRILPVVRDKIAAALVGASGERVKFALSTKVSKAFGFPTPLARLIIDALKLNDPVTLGEKTKGQHLALVRDDPDGTEPSLDPDLSDRSAQAWGAAGAPDQKTGT